MRRRVFRILFLLLIFPMFFKGVKAEEYSDKFIEHYKWIYNDYVVKEKKGTRKYQQMSVTVRNSDKQFVYCVEPGTPIKKNNVYVGSDFNQAYIANMTEEEWEKISLIAYYGYGYFDSKVNHTDLKWYSVTQFMIWQVVPHGYDIYFTDKLDGKKIVKYTEEIREIEDLVKKHNKIPNFGKKNFKISLGDQLKLDDKNLVISEWDINNNSSSIAVKKDNNSLIINPSMIGKYKVKLIKNDEKYTIPPIIYYDSKSQNVMRVGKFKQLSINLEINVVGAKLKINKVDSETKQNIPIKGIKFKIKNLDTGEYLKYKNKDIYETDENGVIITPFTLDYGNYELEEIDQVINGYLWNKETYKFKIDENTTYINDKEQGLIFEINFENKKVKGCVEIIKKGENDLKYLENIKFGLYANEDFYGDDNKIIYKKGDLIDYKFTDKEGKIIFDNLELGKYYVKELQTLKEYVLDKKKYSFELKYKDQYTDVVHYNLNLVNYLKKGELILIKTDNDSGKVIPNTKIELYSENDLLIYSGLTDNNGIINIKDLPYGKYYIVEKLAAPGYINNNEKIYFEIKEDKEIINVNMTNRKMEVEVPSTFKNDLISEILSGVSLITFSLLVYERKKIFIL